MRDFCVDAMPFLDIRKKKKAKNSRKRFRLFKSCRCKRVAANPKKKKKRDHGCFETDTAKKKIETRTVGRHQANGNDGG